MCAEEFAYAVDAQVVASSHGFLWNQASFYVKLVHQLVDCLCCYGYGSSELRVSYEGRAVMDDFWRNLFRSSASGLQVYSEVVSGFLAYEGVVVVVFSFGDFCFYVYVDWGYAFFEVTFDVAVLQLCEGAVSESA